MKYMVRGFVCLAIAAGMSFAALAESYTWKGGTSANFEDAANWEPEGTPGAGDSCTISKPESGETAVTVNTALDIAALTVGGGDGAGTVTLTFANGVTTNIVSGDVSVLAGGTLTHKQQSTTANSEADALYKLILHVGGDMTINGGSVNVDYCGYNTGRGPGGPGVDASGGGAYGGIAWSNSKTTYGSIRNPTDLGSGGAGNRGGVRKGGGAVILDVTGTLSVVNGGLICARGESADQGGGGEGASGGSVNLRVGQLAGTGSILADNDIYGASNWNGAGGRVAVVQRTATDWSSYTGTMRAKGGQKGGPGTVYKQLPGDPYGDLLVANNGWTYDVRSEISSLVTDRDEPFGSVTVKDDVTLKLLSGVTLKVVRKLDTTGGKLTVADESAGVEFVGTDDATWTGAGKGGAIGRLVCIVPGKKISFGNDATKDKVSIKAGGVVTLRGAEENPISLLPADGTKAWNISVGDGANVSIAGVAVSNSVAGTGRVLTASGSVDLGGNDDHWKFIPAIHPGDRITWTGAASASVFDEGNWNPERSVVNTDDVHIPAGTPNALVLTADQSFNKLTVEDGATLTVDGAAITVTNELAVSGTLKFTDAAANRLVLAGAATFAADSFEAGSSTVEIAGDGPQAIHLGGNAFNGLTVAKGGAQTLSDTFTVQNLVCSPSIAATLSFDSDFTAQIFDCEPSAALSLVFPAGKTATISRWILQGADADNQVALVSSAPGTQWLLNLQDADPTFAFVTVTDSDARPGRKVVCREGATVTDGHNNLNWAFGVVSYSWTGDAGDGDFHNAANWSADADPFSPDFVAEIPNPASGALTISVTNALDIADLAVGGGEGAGTVKLDFANGLTTNRVSGNVMVRTGATLTHTANSNAAKYKLNLAVGGNLTVESGASVSADKAGFASNGPGADGYGGAGVYGGKGKGSNVSSYGSIREPTDLGSQGGTGRVGGGAIMLDVDGVLTVNGTVSACGWIAANGGGGNGGSGGSVFLKVGTLAGSSSGIIKADHSAENFAVNYTGSGGRIAIHQRTATDWSSFAGSIHAYAGKDFSNQGDQGGAGTVFMKLPGQSHGDLIVKGGSCAHFGYCITDLSARITDLAEPFDTVTVAESSTLLIREGITLRIAQGLDTTGGQVRCADTTATVELVGDDDFTWRGGKDTTQLRSLVCTIPGKKLYFATGANDVLTLPDDIQCVLHGDETVPLYLLPLEPTEKWKIKLGAETKEDFAYVAVSNSDATVGLKGAKAVSSVDLGGNDKWAFIEPIVPGEEIVWTGLSALDPTDWADADNWNRHRAVEETDAVRIPAGASHYPTIGAGNFILNKVTVEEDGSLQLTGSHLTITNEFNVHGALVCTGTERFDVSATSVDFTGGSVTPAASDFVLVGETDQTVNLGDCTFNYVNVERSGAVSFTGGFSAKHFSARPSAALALTFAADETVTVDMLVLQGFAGGEKLLTLGSSVPGTAWKLKLAKDVQQVAGVRVSDSDASGGVTIRGGSTTTGSNTTNWDFDTDTASWTGGAGTTDFATAGNWAPAVVPGADTVVDLTPLRGETVTVVVPANSPASVRRLMLGSGEGTVKFTAQSPITVREKLEIPANATVALNCFDTPNVVSNDVVIKQGGVLTHDKLKKLYLKTTGNLTIEDGGKIDVNEKGYGPTDPVSYMPPSLFEPFDFGVQGDNQKHSGGVVKLEVSGTLTVNGSIDACGTGGGNGGWAGGGGSIWLTVGTLAGSGRLRAHPCKNPNYPAYDGNYCKPGGRIAVYQRVATNWDAFSAGTMNADGGKRQEDKTCTSPAGTIYLETAADQPRCGEVIIRSDHTFADERTSWPLAGDGDVESSDVYAGVKLTLDGGNLTVTNTAWAEAHTLKIRDMDIQGSNSKAYLNGSTLKVSQTTHRNGRDWEGWTKSDKTAAYAKHVVEDGGAILWSTPGMLLMIR